MDRSKQAGLTAVRVSFRIVGLNGAPIVGAHLTIIRATRPMPEFALLSDSEGVVTVYLPRGSFAVAVHAPDGRHTITDGDAGAGADEVLIEVR
jgi:hypothetical protein